MIKLDVLSDPQGVEWWGVGRFLPPSHRLYEPRLGARIRLTSHEGEVIHDKTFLMLNPWCYYQAHTLYYI